MLANATSTVWMHSLSLAAGVQEPEPKSAWPSGHTSTQPDPRSVWPSGHTAEVAVAATQPDPKLAWPSGQSAHAARMYMLHRPLPREPMSSLLPPRCTLTLYLDFPAALKRIDFSRLKIRSAVREKALPPLVPTTVTAGPPLGR